MYKRFIPAFLLLAYSALLIKVMVFKDLPMIRVGHLIFKFGGADANGQANLIPFKTILPYLLGYKGWIIAGINLAGNIGLLVPVGLLLPFVVRRCTWKVALILSVAAGLLIEGMQVLFQVGIFDIDDVILNALGVLVGYGVVNTFAKWLKKSF